jgi:hypothetical protein
VLSLAERETSEVSRKTIIDILGVSPEAADHVIRSLRRKGWLERGSWGRYLLIPAELELLGERGILDKLAFKGGTCLRKLFIGSQGRFSTDLDSQRCKNTTRKR